MQFEHCLHHANRPEFYNKNLGSLSSIWDRLFGTYFDPDQVQDEFEFGLKNTPSPLRMVVGID